MKPYKQLVAISTAMAILGHESTAREMTERVPPRAPRPTYNKTREQARRIRQQEKKNGKA